MAQYRHCLQILTGCFKINFPHDVYFGSLIFAKLTILRHFVTYLSNDPRNMLCNSCFVDDVVFSRNGP